MAVKGLFGTFLRLWIATIPKTLRLPPTSLRLMKLRCIFSLRFQPGYAEWNRNYRTDSSTGDMRHAIHPCERFTSPPHLHHDLQNFYFDSRHHLTSRKDSDCSMLTTTPDVNLLFSKYVYGRILSASSTAAPASTLPQPNTWLCPSELYSSEKVFFQ